MDVRRVISIGLATLLSTNIYFNIYASESKSINKTNYNSFSEERNINTAILANENFYIRQLLSLDNEEVILTDEQENILKDIELITYDLLEIFIEFGCIDEHGQILNINNLEKYKISEIENYITEINILQFRFRNTILGKENKIKKDKFIEVSKNFGLIRDNQFDYDVFNDLSKEEKLYYKEKLKENI